MNRYAHVGGNTQRFSRITVTPVLGHVVAEEAVGIDRPLTQGLAPGNAQPFRDLHLFAVSGIQNMLQAGINIDFGKVGRLHVGDHFKHFEQLTHQALKRLLSAERF
ncbi:hypothetical protein D3C76_1163740 [compost metagenome]